MLAGHADDPRGSALALRFLGGVHRLVLDGHAPALAHHYPSVGGRAGIDGAWSAFLRTVEEQYLDDAARARVRDTIEEAGRAASARAPIAWLRMEPGGLEADVDLTLRPGGVDGRIARAGYHGRPVRWLAPPNFP